MAKKPSIEAAVALSALALIGYAAYRVCRCVSAFDDIDFGDLRDVMYEVKKDNLGS